MSITKESLAAALDPALQQAGGRVVATSVCEGFLSVRASLRAGAGEQEFDAAAMAARHAAGQHAATSGVSLQSFIVEFMDDAGQVRATRRFGAGGPASPPPGAGHTPIGGLGAPPPRQPTPQGGASSLPGVRRIIAVGAGKGGVGKSSIALSLAVGLARRGHAVGLLDGDIYGPSMPTMLGLHAHEATILRGMLQPFNVHGIKCMTIGKLVDAEKPLIWRGPMAHGAFKQLTEQTDWGELDYLIIDLPPGTGDVSLTMAQTLRLTGAVVVCTPQKVAQDDAVRAAKMFQQLGVEVLGVVENMSDFVADDGKVYDIFGRGGAQAMAQRLNLPFLGAVPITMSLRINSDKGDPTANFEGKDDAGRRLRESLETLCTNLEAQAALAHVRSGNARPTLTIS